MPRPGIPHAAGRGQVWVAVPADDVELIEVGAYRDRKCRTRSIPGRSSPCNAVAVAVVEGGYHCENHLAAFGVWIERGLLMRWQLEATDDEEEA